ncbi:hypothetical protein PC113_g3017 [Phytophthora cactorum]|uniref:Uncharacterized protein n=1 Tax=Phytophthora cactorum TaxID=29920 RepID=A0A8T0ZUT1_9STRA|nr:hypothetical protein PC113_g3017 [Phytophthora cactorum]
MDADDIEFCQSLMPKGACILDYTEYCATPQMIKWKLDCGYFKRDKYGAVVAIRDVAATDQLDLMNRIASEHNPPPEDSGWPKVWGDALAEVCMADRLSTVQWLLKHPTGRQAIAILRGARSLRADKTLSKLLSYPAELCNVEMMQYLYDQGAVDRLGNTLLDAIRANQQIAGQLGGAVDVNVVRGQQGAGQAEPNGVLGMMNNFVVFARGNDDDANVDDESSSEDDDE